MGLTPGIQLANMAAKELRKAELNNQWAYMAALLNMLRELGARVVRIPDPRYTWRADYFVELSLSSALPGTMPRTP